MKKKVSLEDAFLARARLYHRRSRVTLENNDATLKYEDGAFMKGTSPPFCILSAESE